MNIYLIERTDRVGYDEYDSAVIVAEDEVGAINLAKENFSNKWNKIDLSWHEAKVTDLGIAHSNVEEVVHSSFNAG